MKTDMSNADLKVILIGPMSAGKSTIAELLGERLELPRLEMDEIRWSYYPEAGYDDEQAREIYRIKGTLGVLSYCKPFEAYTVARVVSKPGSFVLDLGAGHSVYEDEVLFAKVRAALEPLPFVFLLLPSSDLDRSTEILNARFSALLHREVGEIEPGLLELNEFYVKHSSNERLAKRVIYTHGKSPEGTSDEIVEYIQLNHSG